MYFIYLYFMKKLVLGLKVLFNNFHFNKSELHVPTCYQCLLIRFKNEAMKKLHPKSTIKCFKEVKIDK